MYLKKRYVTAMWVAVGVLGVGLLAQEPSPAGKPKPAAQAQPATPSNPAKSSQTVLPVSPAAPSSEAPSSKDTVGPDEVVLTIGPDEITRSSFELIKQGLPAQHKRLSQQWGDRLFANNYAAFRGLALLAKQEKLDQTLQFKGQLQFMRVQLLAGLAVQRLQDKAQQISREEMKAYYDEHRAEFEQAKVKSIFVAFKPQAKPAAGASATEQEAPKPRTEQQALARTEELRQQLLAGADFSALAKDHSDHKESAQKGGDLGTVRKNQLPASLAKVVFSLKPDQISEPVKEGQGYYILQTQEIRAVTLNEAGANIRRTLQQQKFFQAMEQVKQEFPVVLNEKFFGPQATQSPTPGTARPVTTGVAPAKPGSVAIPAPDAKTAPAPKPKPEKK